MLRGESGIGSMIETMDAITTRPLLGKIPKLITGKHLAVGVFRGASSFQKYNFFRSPVLSQTYYYSRPSQSQYRRSWDWRKTGGITIPVLGGGITLKTLFETWNGRRYWEGGIGREDCTSTNNYKAFATCPGGVCRSRRGLLQTCRYNTEHTITFDGLLMAQSQCLCKMRNH